MTLNKACPRYDTSALALAQALALAAALFCFAAAAQADPNVEGSFVANGETVELPYVYVWAREEGFYDADDPTYTLFFVGRELSAREIGNSVWDAPWIEIGVTESDEFSDGPEVQVYTQSIRMSADAGGNTSGGNYPEIELQGLGTDQISGRVWHAETQTSFDDSYIYDLSFKAALFDPDAPIGDPLPEGGGEPGAAYLKWVEVLHSGDIEALKNILPAGLAEQLSSVSEEEAEEEVGFMRSMTPIKVAIQNGSIDGDEAYLNVQGEIDGEILDLKVTMSRMGEFWIPVETSM